MDRQLTPEELRQQRIDKTRAIIRTRQFLALNKAERHLVLGKLNENDMRLFQSLLLWYVRQIQVGETHTVSSHVMRYARKRDYVDRTVEESFSWKALNENRDVKLLKLEMGEENVDRFTEVRAEWTLRMGV